MLIVNLQPHGGENDGFQMPWRLDGREVEVLRARGRLEDMRRYFPWVL
jgi:hypothetical protein